MTAVTSVSGEGHRANPFHIGLLLPTREATLAGDIDTRSLIELAVLAEELGYDSAWAGESLLARPRLEPLTLLAAVASRTRSLGLGTAVLLGALRQPITFAHAVATLDQIAEGRLVLGLGAGFPMPDTAAEFAAVGVPFGERSNRLVELVRICRLLWSQLHASSPEPGGVSFHGTYWSFDDVTLRPGPYRPGGPPLWLAGATTASLRRTGRVFDGWLPYSPTAELFTEGWQGVQAASAAAGRSASAVLPALYTTIALDADPKRAAAALERYVEAYYGQPLASMAQLQAFYAGDVDGCAEWLGRYVDAGARHIILRFGTLTRHPAAAELAAAEILPRLRQRARLVSGVRIAAG